MKDWCQGIVETDWTLLWHVVIHVAKVCHVPCAFGLWRDSVKSLRHMTCGFIDSHEQQLKSCWQSNQFDGNYDSSSPYSSEHPVLNPYVLANGLLKYQHHLVRHAYKKYLGYSEWKALWDTVPYLWDTIWPIPSKKEKKVNPGIYITREVESIHQNYSNPEK